MAQPSLELTRYGDFLHHSRAALTTRPRRLSKGAVVKQIVYIVHLRIINSHSSAVLKRTFLISLYDQCLKIPRNLYIVVERVHLQFCKTMLGVKRTTQNDFVYGELERCDLRTQRLVSIIKYWFKILMSDDNKYIKGVYTMMLHDLDIKPNKQNWAASVKQLLQSLGFNYVWQYQGVGNINRFLLLLRQRLTDNFIQQWNNRLENSSRARTYSLFHDFSYKVYLDYIMVEKFRNALSRLRMSSHRLAAEAGRWWHKPQSIPFGERKCVNCGVVEDEFHFILECSLYIDIRNVCIPIRVTTFPEWLSGTEPLPHTPGAVRPSSDIRKKYINKYFWARPNIPKFIELMTLDNKSDIKKLASYIFESFTVRYAIT